MLFFGTSDLHTQTLTVPMQAIRVPFMTKLIKATLAQTDLWRKGFPCILTRAGIQVLRSKPVYMAISAVKPGKTIQVRNPDDGETWMITNRDGKVFANDAPIINSRDYLRAYWKRKHAPNGESIQVRTCTGHMLTYISQVQKPPKNVVHKRKVEPQDCECKNWDNAVSNLHHVDCPHYEPREVSDTLRPTESSAEKRASFVVDLETGKRLRAATREETAEALDNLEKHGAPTIMLDSREYLVEMNEGYPE